MAAAAAAVDGDELFRPGAEQTGGVALRQAGRQGTGAWLSRAQRLRCRGGAELRVSGERNRHWSKVFHRWDYKDSISSVIPFVRN